MAIKSSELVSDFDFTEDYQKEASAAERARSFVQQRQVAYQQVFDPTTPSGFAVLADLAHFCRGNRSVFDPNPTVMAGMVGMREVWLRIQQHLALTDEQLAALYRKGTGL